MPGTINTHPRGLLGLLDAKTDGRTPTDLPGTMSMVLDIFPFYLAQRRETISSNTAAVGGTGAIFPTANFAVPQDEIWLVDALSVVANAACAAGETLGILPMHRSQNTAGNTADVHRGLPLSAGVTVGAIACCAVQAPFLAVAGDALGAFIYFRTLFAGTLRLDAEILRIKI